MTDDIRTITMTIPANKTGKLLGNINRLNKKAAVQRAGKFEATFGEERTIFRPIDPSLPMSLDPLTGKMINGYPVRVIPIEVTGPSFSIGGYDIVCLANLGGELRQYTDFNNASGFDGYEEITTACEHCNTDRIRVHLFVLRNVETGAYIQVGKTCLKDFTGLSPADALKGAGFWEAFGTFEEEMLRGSVEQGRGLIEVLETATAIIADHGYVSRAQADDWERPQKATSDRVAEALYDGRDCPTITDDTRTQAAATLAWAEAKFTDTSDAFNANVLGILQAGYVPAKMTGFAACLPALKQREEQRARIAAERGNSEHFGEPKQRLEADFEVVAESFFDNEYGGTTRYTMMVDGNVAIWWASRPALEVGQTGTAKMTVKKHDEYEGTKQTIVNRVTVKEAA